MDLNANCFAAAVLVLLLAINATDAAPRNENAVAASHKKIPIAPPRAEVEAPQPEENAVSVNAEEVNLQAPSQLSLCKLIPHITPEEQQECEAALRLPNFEDRYEAVLALLAKQVRASGTNDQGLKLSSLLEKLNDPEVRNELTHLALGAAGMAVTGLMLGNGAMLHQLALMSLYVTAFFQLMKSGAQLASKLVSDDVEQEILRRAENVARRRVAQWVLVGPDDDATSQSVSDQKKVDGN